MSGMGPSWLTTLGPKDTLPHNPRSTIVPAPAAETTRRRALEALSRLRDDAPMQLEQTATLDLLREAWITGRLEHPNIVPVYSLGVEADGSPLVVYKRIEAKA